jgi:hypothetical protein
MGIPDATGPTEQLDALRAFLVALPPTKFEQLAIQLIGDLLDLRLTQANAGFQHGGDGGPVGRGGRRFRVEAKRYTSDLSARDLIGGFQQALMNDEGLEAWFPIAAREISEQIASQLEEQSNKDGVPITAIDWKHQGVPALAALCTSNPSLVGEIAGDVAGKAARTLIPFCADELHRLTRELQDWHIGFESIRAVCRADLESMWRMPRAALNRLAQDAAGGADRPLIRRATVSHALDIWWSDAALRDAPATLLGLGGMGKTWAALAWMLQRDDLPIIVTLPSGALTVAARTGVAGIEKILGDRLAEITMVRDGAYWSRRVRQMLRRPKEQGPVFCLLLDGINQNPSVEWLSLLHSLQDKPFSGRVRCIVTVRQLYFENSLGRLRRLAEPPSVVPVDQFDAEPGGEFDQMLAAVDLTRGDLAEGLERFARTPRLFTLVIRHRARLAEGGIVTVHRLLWEYGRDTLGLRSENSFTDQDWQAWLMEIARREREGHKYYTRAEIVETASRADLESSRVAARISDIVDGNFTTTTSDGRWQLTPEIVAQALGIALLFFLEEVARQRQNDVLAALEEWLDPISGLDERAELLRAAASIIAERNDETSPQVASAVVTAWLQTQNLPPEHEQEVRRLAPSQVDPLLSAIEFSDGGARESARQMIVDALRSIDRTNLIAYGLIIERCTRWMSHISRDVTTHREGREQIEASRAARLLDRVGFDESRTAEILGVRLEFVERRSDRIASAVASLIDGLPLAGAGPVFLRFALALAIRGRDEGWDSIRWVCLFNPIDPSETADALRILARDIAGRAPESGVNAQLAGRVAALLLWLTGFDEDADQAVLFDSGIDHPLTYEKGIIYVTRQIFLARPV